MEMHLQEFNEKKLNLSNLSQALLEDATLK
jgi:hypothetical protein